MGTPYPGLVKPEVHASAGFLLLPLCFESGVSAFLSSAGGEGLSLCKTGGQSGEPRNCCDVRNPCLGVQQGSTSCQEGQGGTGSREQAQLSSAPWLLWALPPPPTFDLSKEAYRWIGSGVPLWGRIPRCLRPLSDQIRACIQLSI